jgi:hypothetical protein
MKLYFLFLQSFLIKLYFLYLHQFLAIDIINLSSFFLHKSHLFLLKNVTMMIFSQIFINLGTINATLQNTIENSLSECRECLKTAFDSSNVSSGAKVSKGPGRITLTSSQGFRNKMWIEIEKAFAEEIYQNCKQVPHMHKLERKYSHL